MSEIGKELSNASDSELEQLLRRASPRQTPGDAAVAATRVAVHDEWRKVVGQQQRRGLTRWAVAATVLITLFSVVSLYRPGGVDVVQVAEIQKSFGAVSIFGTQSPPSGSDNLVTVHSGQTIVTGLQAGMAIAWGNGGSIRIDRNTKLEFLSDSAIFLHTGRIYFDSTPSHLIAAKQSNGPAQFVVKTELGLVSHSGTQFMTRVDGGSLTVSVREGRVTVQGAHHDAIVGIREKVRMTERRMPVSSTDSGHGKEWSWITKTTPPIDAGGESIDNFLNWAARELGLEVDYETRDVQQIAMQKEILGLGSTSGEPRAALALYMETTTLRAEIDGGTIHVRIDE